MRQDKGTVVLWLAMWMQLLVGGVARADEPPADKRPPNVIIIFADDMGYGDAGCYGSKTIKTPNLDRMAAEGVRFTDFYAAQAVCSASRAALLTGCYPNRVGISGALGPRARVGLNPDETTIAEVCKSRGYATAIYGKWHLGDAECFMPTHHGFDEYYGYPYSHDMWPMHPDLMGKEMAERKKRYPSLPLLESDPTGGKVHVADEEVTPEEQASITRRITEHAERFIEKNADKAFFLYVPHPMPHVPLFGPPEYVGRSEYGRYGDIIEELDWSTGRILDAVKKAGIEDCTLVVFTSDNGPWLSYGLHAGTTGGLREGKGTSWEGGVREPFIARWPGRIPAGTVCREPAMTIDLLPTIAGLIGAPLPEKRIDGLNIWPLMSGRPDAKSPHEALLFYYNQNDLEAIRSGRWKLQLPHSYRTLAGEPGRDGKPGPYKQIRCGLELYDLEADPGEEHDVAADNPEVVNRLQTLVEKARADLGDGLTKREGSGRRPAGRVEGAPTAP